MSIRTGSAATILLNASALAARIFSLISIGFNSQEFCVKTNYENLNPTDDRKQSGQHTG